MDIDGIVIFFFENNSNNEATHRIVIKCLAHGNYFWENQTNRNTERLFLALNGDKQASLLS